MSLIDKKSFILDEEEDKDLKPYTLPTLVTSKAEILPIEKTVAIAAAAHPAIVILLWLVSIVLMLMGINLDTFGKIKPEKKQDIQFVLVDKPGKPRDPNTKNRADMNSRSGGVNDPKRALSMPSAPVNKAKPKSVQKQAAPKKIQPKPVAKQQAPQAKPVNKPAQQSKPSPAKPAPPTAKPSARPVAAPTPVAKPSTPFAVPAPKAAPIGKSLSTGPIGGTSAPTGLAKSSSGGSGASSGAYAPRPSLSPSLGGGSGQLGRTAPSGNGNIGNPGGGGGTPGIDALREPDFGPYMRELQRRIKLNWDPPKGNESKTVVLLFKVARDGRLLSCRVHRSSGMPTADNAALKAVELTAPFRPLPADFKGQSIDIQFTFDYKVFGASRY